MTERRTLAGLLARRARRDAGMLALLCVIVVVAAFAVTATPRALELLVRAEVGAAVAESPTRQQSLVGQQSFVVSLAAAPSSDVVADLAAAARSFADELPHPLPSVLGDAGAALLLPPALVTGTRGDVPFERAVAVGAAADWAGQVRFVAGAAPGAWDGRGPLPAAMSQATADALGVSVGDVLEGASAPLRITGLFEPLDSAAPLWAQVSGAASAVEIGLQGSPPRRLAAAFIDPRGIPELGDTLGTAQVYVWLPLDVSALKAQDAATAALLLRQTSAIPQALPGGQDVLFDVGPAPAIEASLDRVAAATTLFALIVAGPLAVALAAVALALSAIRGRRAGPLLLARERGASGTQLRLAAAAETAVATLPASVLGAVAAVTVTAEADALSGWPGALALVLVAVAIAAGAAAPPTSGTNAAVPLRLAVEALVVAVAAASVVLLLQRGLGSRDGGLDPLVAATPVLLAAAVAVGVQRAQPILLRALQRAGARLRGAVPVVGVARSRRPPVLGYPATFSLVGGVSVAALAVGLLRDLPAGSGPLAMGLPVALILTGVLTLAGGLTATTVAVLSGTAARTASDRILAILGFAAGQLRALATWEVIPAAFVAVAAGSLLGIGEILLAGSALGTAAPPVGVLVLPALSVAAVFGVGLIVLTLASVGPRRSSAVAEETP